MVGSETVDEDDETVECTVVAVVVREFEDTAEGDMEVEVFDMAAGDSDFFCAESLPDNDGDDDECNFSFARFFSD